MIDLLAATLVFIGSVLLFLAFFPALAVWRDLPAGIRKRWLPVPYHIGFFLLGYLVFDALLLARVAFPTQAIVGAVFLAGALFVFMMTSVVRATIQRMKQAEDDLQAVNQTLEKRVAERTDDLQRSRDFVKTVLDSLSDPISIIDAKDFTIVGANRVFLQEFKAREDEVLGRKCHEVTHGLAEPCQSQNETCPLVETLAHGGHATALHIHRDAEGGLLYEEVLTSPIRDAQGNIVQVVHTARNVTERKRAEEQIRTLAYYDPLTRLPNRRFYMELLSRALLSAQRSHRLLAVLFIDLDSFKRINDTLGHADGDRLLQETAQRLVSCIRQTDTVGRLEEDSSSSVVSRLGGDEFIVLLGETSRPDDAAQIAQRILKRLAAPFVLKGGEVTISASIGISLYPADGEDADTLLKNADIAMYQAKEQGKNTFRYFSTSMNATSLERLTLEGDLRKALEREEFVLHYQPKVDISSRRIIGAEALIRWKHAARGLVSPADFVPVAEETGFIAPIGEWVLRAATRQNRLWQDAGVAPFRVSVNVSVRQLEQEDLLGTVAAILESTGMDPRLLELEITESSVMRHPEKAITVLRDLKALGVGISVDDFGTGYSSLAYLRRLPLDCLKIDRSFVANITSNPDDAAIAAAIVALAHTLKLTVVAEGIEREDQLAVLQRMACDHAQGYLFSRPLPVEDFFALLQRQAGHER